MEKSANKSEIDNILKQFYKDFVSASYKQSWDKYYNDKTSVKTAEFDPADYHKDSVFKNKCDKSLVTHLEDFIFNNKIFRPMQDKLIGALEKIQSIDPDNLPFHLVKEHLEKEFDKHDDLLKTSTYIHPGALDSVTLNRLQKGYTDSSKPLDASKEHTSPLKTPETTLEHLNLLKLDNRLRGLN